MKKKNVFLNKTLIIGIVILFLSVSVSPGLNARINEKLTEEIYTRGKGQVVTFKVTEFKSDGTTEKTVVEITHEEAKELKNKLKNIKTSGEQLSLYKKYGLIPEDVTLEQLKTGMKEKAERNGLTEDKLNQLIEKVFSKRNYSLKLNQMCYVSVTQQSYLRLIFGLSFITRAINAFIWSNLDLNFYVPSIDLLNSHLGFFDDINVKNGLSDNIYYSTTFFGIVAMLCFVGFYIHESDSLLFWFFPFLTHTESWFGYAAFVIVYGEEIECGPCT